MNNITQSFPQLTPNDIIILRGQPLAKRNESSRKPVEEWMYYNAKTKTKELYVFKNETLVEYKNISV